MVWSWSVRIGAVVYGLLILTVFQDVLKGCVGNRVQGDRFRAGPVNTDAVIGAAEIDHRHAGSICLFFKFRVIQQRADEPARVPADLPGLLSVIRSVITVELGHGLVVLRHVFEPGHVAPAAETPEMERDPVVHAVEDLDLFRIRMDDHALFVIRVRNGIIKPVVRNVIVIADAWYRHRFKRLKRVFGERPERRSVQRGKHAFSGTGPVLEILLDKLQDAFPYIMVQSVKAVIQLAFQPFKEPGLKPADTGFHGWFVLGLTDPCRHDRYLVVSGQRHVRLIELRVVKARMDNSGLTIIRHEDPWKAAIP